MLLRLASADSSLATAEVFELFVEGLVFYSKNITVDFVFSRLSEYDTFGEASWFCEWNYNRNSWRIHLPYAFLTNLSVEFNEMNESDLWSGLISTLLERIFSEKQIILKPSNLSRQNFSIISWSWKLRLLNKKKIYFILLLYEYWRLPGILFTYINVYFLKVIIKCSKLWPSCGHRSLLEIKNLAHH